jgi:uncharacterized membrane protein YhaH (DUF805 family)
MHAFVEFIFPCRLHRLAFFMRGTLTGIVEWYLYSYGSIISSGTTLNQGVWFVAIIALFIYDLLFIDLPRINDLGMSAWWLLVSFVPFANIWLGLILIFRAPSYVFPIRSNQFLEPSADGASDSATQSTPLIGVGSVHGR